MKSGWTFIAGLTAGIAVGVLFAPRSGEETQELIGDKARAGWKQVASTGRKAGEAVKNLTDKGKGQMADAIEAGKTVYQKARAEASAAMD